MEKIANYVILFGGSLACFVSLGQLLHRDRKNINHLSVSLLACVGTYLIYNGLLYSGDMERDFPHLMLLFAPILYPMGPLLYYFFWSLLNPNEFRASSLRYLFLLPVAVLLLLLPVYLEDSAYKGCMNEVYRSFLRNEACFQDLYGREMSLYEGFAAIVLAAPKVLALASLLLFLVRLRPFGTDIPLFQFVFNLTCIIFLLAIGGHALKGFFPNAGPNKLAALAGSLLLLWMLLLDYRKPTYFVNLAARTKKKAEENVKKRIEPDDVIARLQHLMDEEKLYQVEGLSLRAAAADVGVSYHDLSFLINQRLHMNFNDFVNYNRIREACRLLLADKDRKIIDIALEVGFGAVDTFNRAFRKFMGCTPSKYRKNKGTGATEAVTPVTNRNRLCLNCLKLKRRILSIIAKNNDTTLEAAPPG